MSKDIIVCNYTIGGHHVYHVQYHDLGDHYEYVVWHKGKQVHHFMQDGEFDEWVESLNGGGLRHNVLSVGPPDGRWTFERDVVEYGYA